MKRGFDHLHFEENRTGNAFLSELERSKIPNQVLDKINKFCSDKPALFENEFLRSNRERFLKDLKQIILDDTKRQKKLKQKEWARCMDTIKSILVKAAAHGETSALPGDASLDLGNFVGFILDKTPKDSPKNLNEIISLISSTLYTFNMSKQKLKFGKALMEYLVKQIDEGEDKKSVLQVIRYITTGCTDNAKKFIDLAGEQKIYNILDDDNESPDVRGLACVIIANICSVDSSLLKKSGDIIFLMNYFIWEHNGDPKICCMGLTGLFALVKDDAEKLTMLYLLGWNHKLRLIRRYHRIDIIYLLCTGIITLFEQLNLFWNIHTEREDKSELFKAIIVTLKNSPSIYLAKYALNILRMNILINEYEDVYRDFLCMSRINAFSVLKELVKYEDCKKFIKDIMHLAFNNEQTHKYLQLKDESYSVLIDSLGFK